MKNSDVVVAGGKFDTYIQCTKCSDTFDTQVWADDADYAASNTIGEAEESGWTSDEHGALCPKCAKKREPRKKK
jgi:hypothetical protein